MSPRPWDHRPWDHRPWDEAALAAAYRAACLAELAAPKPGNVHRFAAGHGMTVADFERAAEVSAAPLCRRGARLGARILEAVAATRAAVGQNANLGIILLCAPLAMAAEVEGNLAEALEAVLAGATIADTADLFAAIRLAAPGGLGEAPRHDVRAPPEGSPRAAMCAAAGRDLIARQWCFAAPDLFALGLPALRAWRARGWDYPALAPYFAFLAAFPDSHIQRKEGQAAAERVRREAARLQAALWAGPAPEAHLPALLAWDQALKEEGLNPGTSADLTVATLFLEALLAGPAAQSPPIERKTG
jgi:triphosphoribosyl-dephospho-CoA synthase